MRKTCDSSKTACTSAFSLRADSRSVPNGFSMITRASLARPAVPSMRTTEMNAAGGTARWNSRRGVPPISFSARWIASVSSSVLPGSAGAKDRRRSKSGQDGSSGLVMQKSAHACLARARNSSSVTANCGGEVPTAR